MQEAGIYANITDICLVDKICGVNAQYRIQGNAVYTNEYKKSALSAGEGSSFMSDMGEFISGLATDVKEVFVGQEEDKALQNALAIAQAQRLEREAVIVQDAVGGGVSARGTARDNPNGGSESNDIRGINTPDDQAPNRAIPFIRPPKPTALLPDGTMPLFNVVQPGYTITSPADQNNTELPKVFRNDESVIRTDSGVMPFYPGASNNTPSSNSSFSFIPTANAYSGTAIYGGVELGIEGLLGGAYATWKNANNIVGLAKNSAPAVALATLFQAEKQSAQFYEQHPALSPDLDDMLLNPYITESFKDELWNKAVNDPLFKDADTIPVSSDGKQLDDEIKSVSFTSSIAKPVSISQGLANATTENYEPGLCKYSYPYNPEHDYDMQDWMGKRKITGKYRQLLEGVQVYGLNPMNVKPDGEMLRVNTELPGGELGARECFKNLTGIEAPIYLLDGKAKFIKPNGDVVMLRSPDSSTSGHWKVNNNQETTGVDEKITFKSVLR